MGAWMSIGPGDFRMRIKIVKDSTDKKVRKYLEVRKLCVILQPQFDKSWNVLETI